MPTQPRATHAFSVSARAQLTGARMHLLRMHGNRGNFSHLEPGLRRPSSLACFRIDTKWNGWALFLICFGYFVALLYLFSIVSRSIFGRGGTSDLPYDSQANGIHKTCNIRRPPFGGSFVWILSTLPIQHSSRVFVNDSIRRRWCSAYAFNSSNIRTNWQHVNAVSSLEIENFAPTMTSTMWPCGPWSRRACFYLFITAFVTTITSANNAVGICRLAISYDNDHLHYFLVTSITKSPNRIIYSYESNAFVCQFGNAGFGCE